MNVTQIRSRNNSDPDRRQSNMCYRPLYARLLCVVLTVITFATSIIPAEAASDLLMTDLLLASEYNAYSNDEYKGVFVEPVRYQTGSNSAEFRWVVNTNKNYNWIHFTVLCSTKPTSMKVKFYYSDSWNEASYVGNFGNIYEYRVRCGKTINDVTVRAEWNNYTGSFCLYSFVGQQNVGDSLDTMNVYNAVVTTSGGETSTKPIHNSTGVSVPHSYVIRRDSSIQWLTTLCFLDITEDYRSFNHMEKMIFLLHGVNLKNFEISLCDSSLNPVHVLTPTVSEAEMRSSVVYGENDYPFSYYEVSVDLSDYDLGGLIVRLGFESSSFVYNVATRQASYTVDSIVAVPYIEDIPWYKTFWNWLVTKWDSVTSSIKSSISSAADKITAAFAGASQQNEQLNQAGQAMSDQADSMNQSQAELDAVEKPSLDPDNFFGDMLTFDTGGLQILSAITSNAQVTSMLVVVFTFALCGYIFFGKKG